VGADIHFFATEKALRSLTCFNVRGFYFLSQFGVGFTEPGKNAGGQAVRANRVGDDVIAKSTLHSFWFLIYI